jgi:Protein of unknown function (DUF3048) N-terminal domain/Protein of unknown function (DUF3048) C-terminal domain
MFKGGHGGRRVVGAVAVASLVALTGACGGDSNRSAIRATTSATTTTTTTTPSTTPPLTTVTTARPRPKTTARRAAIVHQDPRCPLTGLEAPDGHVPQRAALAVKVENLPQARPQWGLDKAEIVFEEPVEGGITRFIAVYQCDSAARIEPVRSARLVDPKILEPLGRMLFAYSGGIQWAVDEIDSKTSLLSDVGAVKAGSAYSTDPTREAPHNLETSTAALYAAAAAMHYPEKPPTAIFSYGPPVLGGYPAAVANISYPLDVTTWTWHRDTGLWYRSYSDTGPAIQGDNVQITASNVVIMLVEEHPTPYPEDDTGALENDLALKGSGTAWVLRDGTVFYAHWERPLLDHPAVFIDDKTGATITLTPGNTWEELVPIGLNVSVQH